METRTVTQTKIYSLIMNPVTANAEAGRITAIAFEKEKLVAWYESQKHTEKWKDGGFYKTFKPGSHLEWFNPLYTFEPDDFGHGIHEEWVVLDHVNISNYYIVR
jgi:hypothetical protein